MVFLSNKPQASVIEVTPELARQLLDTSPGNRRMRSWYIDQLGAAMKNGDWLVTSQGIGIDNQGQLRDAHHRLTASVKHNVSFPSLVVWGLLPACYQVVDRGMLRSYSDILNLPKAVAEAVRLGAALATKNARPSAADIKPYIDAGLASALEALSKTCSTKVKYFSSAPVRLAAVATLMNGGDADYVYSQYRALVIADYDSMSSSSKALTRQVSQALGTGSGLSGSMDAKDKLARTLKVFDKDRQHLSKIQISDIDRDLAVEFVRSVLNKAIAENHGK
jgi:hypothetical protein